jgi:murein DD-endopeptidase MepM/ murein hydrolase activator NlpD
MFAATRRRATVLVSVLAAVASLGSRPSWAADPVGEWPLQPEPEVVRAFDPPDTPWGSGHRGVDLLGWEGQLVHAALPGTVAFAGMLAGRGVVVVSHGETRTTYEPVTATVAVGASVGQGAVLGTLEGAASHCSPRACLHWGWLRGATYLDPLRLVGTPAVRLLPLWRDQPVEPLAPVAVPAPALLLGLWTMPYAAVLEGLARLAAPAPPR